MNFVNPLAVSTVNSKLEIKIGNRSTGLILELRPASSPEVKAMEKRRRTEAAEASRSTGGDIITYTFENLDEGSDERVIAHVAGWEWSEGVDPSLAEKTYSVNQLKQFLAAVPFGDCIRSQVLKHVAKEENFFVLPVAS